VNVAAIARDAGAQSADRSALQRIGRSAVVALYDELTLYPKPGLVSLVDAGSHGDMNAATFMRSLFALRHYFPHIVAAGARNLDFNALEQRGIEAERAMLCATGGINTHRGAIFSLGLLCAAAGRLLAEGERATPTALRAGLLARWGRPLRERCRLGGDSNGHGVARRFGLRSAGEEAAAGFPVLFEVTLPALQRARAKGLSRQRSQLQALMQTMTVLDDTNLAHRGGIAGLRWAQQRAREFVDAGGAAQPAALEQAKALHVEFVARRLSPGGCADLLAAACWVDRLGPAR
jgi:triphosphoribosyl-dephospho-CoA synthase